ncbi:MAG: EVE domain-containing protein [Terriglobales bacterium]
MSAWLGVVSRSHVVRGVGLGIAQVMHGKRAGLARMRPGDWLVYYSPRTAYPDGDPLKAFTAIGRIADEEIWQADEGDFHPYRRRVDYLDIARELPLSEVSAELELTAQPNWGYQLRRGLIPLSDADVGIIRDAASRKT